MIADRSLLVKSVLSNQEIRNGITQKGETLSWLKSRLKHLIDVSSEKEAQKRGDELAELSSSFKVLVALLSEVMSFTTLDRVLRKEAIVGAGGEAVGPSLFWL